MASIGNSDNPSLFIVPDPPQIEIVVAPDAGGRISLGAI
jgi:hypothetical protein